MGYREVISPVEGAKTLEEAAGVSDLFAQIVLGSAYWWLAPRLGPVVRLLRDDPPNTSAWIGYITLPARDDMDVHMRHGLSCHGAVVQADVEVVAEPFGAHADPFLRCHREQSLNEVWIEVRQAPCMDSRDDEQVPV